MIRMHVCDEDPSDIPHLERGLVKPSEGPISRIEQPNIIAEIDC